MRTVGLFVIWLMLVFEVVGQSQDVREQLERQTSALRALIASAPKPTFAGAPVRVVPPRPNWELAMVSWVATGRDDRVYMLQRGDRADPVVVLNRDGQVVRSWGKGMFTMPHAIRVDPQGNVWTTDAASSMVTKFSADGLRLMQIEIGGQPTPCPRNFCSTTDIAFAPNGHLYISDGYSNARILEYTADGRRVRQWGEPGMGPGQFRLPHSIQVDESGVVYVADRENGRVQRFDLEGRFLGEWKEYGKTFGLALDKEGIWLASQPRELPNGSPGWLIKLDRGTGRLLTYVEAAGNHGIAVSSTGEVFQAPGPMGLTSEGYSGPIPHFFKNAQRSLRR
ncbi:MAG: hypothetical protein HW416_3640 [Chloroflexi bacterium]|nr:hypothetical protein [Chloroflexota bacterium]